MILDERTVQNGITPQILAKLIEKHENTIYRYRKLKDYYLGRHKILDRRREAAGLANNKIVCNHAKYITDMSTAYLIGNPVSYAPSEDCDIEALKNTYLEQGIERADKEIVKKASIYGKIYELIYANEESKPRSVVIDPKQAFVVYNDDCTHIPLFGVYYYKTYDVDGNIKGVVCNVYTDTEVLTYENSADSWSNMYLTFQGSHYFGGVPLIEYKNNDEEQGDYEQLIPLIDAYNKMTSERLNDKEQFVNAFLFLKNVEITSEGAKLLRQERILMATPGAQEDADAKYLAKILNEADMKILRDDYKEDIHRLSMVPDLSDDSFGNNLSGVAIRYKLMAFEQHTKEKEGYIAEGLKKRFTLYNKFLSTKGQMAEVPIHRVDIVFTHNLPVNNYEISQMITNLKEHVSNETLISQLDFVADPEEETVLVQKQQDEKQERRMRNNEDYAEGGGY